MPCKVLLQELGMRLYGEAPDVQALMAMPVKEMSERLRMPGGI